MTKDFLLGLAWGLLLALFLIWLFDRKPDTTPPDTAARQPVKGQGDGDEEPLPLRQVK